MQLTKHKGSAKIKRDRSAGFALRFRHAEESEAVRVRELHGSRAGSDSASDERHQDTGDRPKDGDAAFERLRAIGKRVPEGGGERRGATDALGHRKRARRTVGTGD